MSHYVFGTSLSYVDYLQAKSFEDNFRADIKAQTRALVASAEQLQHEKISVLSTATELQREGNAIAQRTVAAIESGFETLSFQMLELTEGVHELNATFHWGFSNLLRAVDTMNDSLQQLIRIAKTPAQTWAYEQFEIARDAFRQELWDEAIEHVDRAISGFAGQTGFKLEHRFHFLLGTLRLGSVSNRSPSVVNLEAAQTAFLNAARYATHDYRKEAARAFLAAGWAAYCAGDTAVAKQHSESAIACDSELAEAHYQLAKVLLPRAEPSQALGPLRRSIRLDRNYAIKAASDGDFQSHETELNECLEGLRADAMRAAETCIATTTRTITTAESTTVGAFRLPAYASIDPPKASLNRANRAMVTGTYFGYLDAIDECRPVGEAIRLAVRQFVDGAKADCAKEVEAVKAKMRVSYIAIGPIPQYVFALGTVVSFFVAWRAFFAVNAKHAPLTTAEAWWSTFLWGIVISGGISLFLRQILWKQGKDRNDYTRQQLEAEKDSLLHVDRELDRLLHATSI